MLGLRSGRLLLLLLVLLLLGLLGLGLGLSLGLSRWGVLDGLGDEDGLGASSELVVPGLVEDGVEVTEDAGVGVTDVLAVEGFAAALDAGGKDDIGNGDALGSEEGLLRKLLLKDIEERLDSGLGGVDVLFVVGQFADQRLEPLASVLDKFHVGEAGPLEDGGALLEGAAEERDGAKTDATGKLREFPFTPDNREHTYAFLAVSAREAEVVALRLTLATNPI